MSKFYWAWFKLCDSYNHVTCINLMLDVYHKNGASKYSLKCNSTHCHG